MHKPLIVAAVMALVLVGCGEPSAPTPDEPEESESPEEWVQGYVDTYGGSAGQYRVILNAACPELRVLDERLAEKVDAEEDLSPQWRAALGYWNAVGNRLSDLDC